MTGSVFFVIFVALCLTYRIWLGRTRALPTAFLPTHFATTKDGARIALYRRANPGKEVVVMVHGLGSNHFNFDFPHAGSPAALYHEAGYDVWTIDLRGHCHSSHGRGKWFAWGFDDFLDLDLPAALELVAKETDDAPLHWVGHSMGGMLFYALAGTNTSFRFSSAVTFGSPISFYPSTRFERWAHRNQDLLVWLRIFPIQVFLRWFNPFLPWGPRKAIASQMFVENVDWQMIHKAAFHSTSNVSMRLMMDFARWVATDKWDSTDGTIDYRTKLCDIEVPVLVVAGSEDHLCPAKDVRRAFEMLGCTDKQYLESGTACGFQNEYGHIDLVFGIHTASETIAQAIAWADAHTTES